MDFWLAAILDASTAIAVLALLSLGLYITYGVLRVVNMAHGEMLTIGAYAVARLSSAGWPFPLATLASSLMVGIFGLVLERLVIRPLHARRDLSTLLATWGAGLVVTESIRLTFGPSGEFVDAPTNRILLIGTVPYPAFNLWLVGISAFLLLSITYLLAATQIGVTVRATIENPQLAALRGISNVRIYRWGFALGSAVTGLAGALLAPISAVSPTMGVEYATLAFMVVIVGGMSSDALTYQPRSRLGTIFLGSFVILPFIAGCVLVGGSRSLLNALIGITPATLGMLVLVLLALFVRPNGLLSGGQ